MRHLLVTCFCFFGLWNSAIAQSFSNGDLEVIVSGFDDIPNEWNKISVDHVFCQANIVEGATPDGTDAFFPSVEQGVIGNAFSGNSFISGLHAVWESNGMDYVWHEGIEQTIDDLEIGQEYKIIFYQSVVKQIVNSDEVLDTSGSWVVFMDFDTIGITEPSLSYLAYDDLNLSWDKREIIFTATATSHDFLFLPLDDDSDQKSNGENGRLRMGIDLIELSILSGIKNDFELERITIFPNPFEDHLVIRDINENAEEGVVDIISSTGIVLSNIKFENHIEILTTELQPGLYYLRFRFENKDKPIWRKVIKL